MIAVRVLGCFLAHKGKSKSLSSQLFCDAVTGGKRGTGIDCCSTLTFRSESKQMEMDDGFNYFGARAEKKARGSVSPCSAQSLWVMLCVMACS